MLLYYAPQVAKYERIIVTSLDFSGIIILPIHELQPIIQLLNKNNEFLMGIYNGERAANMY